VSHIYIFVELDYDRCFSCYRSNTRVHCVSNILTSTYNYVVIHYPKYPNKWEKITWNLTTRNLPFLQTMHWTVEIDCGFRNETTIYVTKNEVQHIISNMQVFFFKIISNAAVWYFGPLNFPFTLLVTALIYSSHVLNNIQNCKSYGR
jgi:hypothetical protein